MPEVDVLQILRNENAQRVMGWTFITDKFGNAGWSGLAVVVPSPGVGFAAWNPDENPLQASMIIDRMTDLEWDWIIGSDSIGGGVIVSFIDRRPGPPRMVTDRNPDPKGWPLSVLRGSVAAMRRRSQ